LLASQGCSASCALSWVLQVSARRQMPLTAKDVSSLRVAELKEECRARGLKVSGVKQELTNRLKLHLRTQAKATTCVPPKPSKPPTASVSATKLSAVEAPETRPNKDVNLAVSEVQIPVAPAPHVPVAHPDATPSIPGDAALDQSKSLDQGSAEQLDKDVEAPPEASDPASASLGAEASPGYWYEKSEGNTSSCAAEVEPQQPSQMTLHPATAPCLDTAQAENAPAAVASEADDLASRACEALADVDISSAEAASTSTDAGSKCATTLKEKPETSRSPPAWLKDLPTATRRRLASPAPESRGETCLVKFEEASARSRSPMIHRAPVLTGDQIASTPSKFAGMLDKLKAKAEAKERGEDFSSSWTPRASPMRMQMQQRWQTPPRGPAAASLALPSPAASVSTMESVGARLLTTCAVAATPPQGSPLSSVTLPSPACARASLAVTPSAEAGLSGASTPLSKRQSLLQDKKQLLQELTDKLKVCLQRLQDRSLDEKSVGKYQELAKAIQKQMDAINIHGPERSLAFPSSPASARPLVFPCSPAARFAHF